MPTLPLNAGHNTLIDIAKSFGPDGKVAILAELLNQSNEVIYDMNWIEGNLPTGHKSVVRTSLPTVALTRFYQGVPISKSGRATVEDVCAMQKGRNIIDQELADLNGNTAAFRMSEALGFVEAMNEGFAQEVFYGNVATNKDGILGLAPRYNSLEGISGQNIINAGGTGNTNTSVWLVGWGENTVTGFYPKGSKAGLQQEDLGVIDEFDASGNRYRAYSELWKWNYGLCVKDWRYAVRIANISVPDMIGQANTQAITASTWLNKLMIRALQRIPSMGTSRCAFYANRSVKEMLSIGALDKSQNALSFTEAVNQYGTVTAGSVAGAGTGISGGILKFMGVPVRTVDQLLITEATVS